MTFDPQTIEEAAKLGLTIHTNESGSGQLSGEFEFSSFFRDLIELLADEDLKVVNDIYEQRMLKRRLTAEQTDNQTKTKE